MSWKDFFYFSKGERRALTLLLCLISSFLILLFFKEEANKQQSLPTRVPESLPETRPETTPSIPKQPLPSESPKTQTEHPGHKKYTPNIRYKKSTSVYSQKYPRGTVLELNNADTTSLKKIPGIGSTFAKRIIKYRQLLGGYVSVSQLQEVYGIDEEKYNALAAWFDVDTTKIQKLAVNKLSIDTLIRHPYLNYQQARILVRLRERKGPLSGWQNLDLLEEFNEKDKARLAPYLSFE
jgi:hypothetical protein